MKKNDSFLRLGGKSMVFPFILVTSLFFFWGIANNMTDTLLAAFKKIMSMNDTRTSFIQMAFYGSYFCFALPAALFIKKFSYKYGIILGLSLYAFGTIMFYPASIAASYGYFLVAIYIMAGGCSVLETTANPYILSMGSPETATRRLNLAQSFNPIGSITGILLSKYFILGHLNSAGKAQRALMSNDQLAHVRSGELKAVTSTYMGVGFVLIAILIIIICCKMPQQSDSDKRFDFIGTMKRLIKNKLYINGVVAQFFYVGAQIGVWSFTIRMVMNDMGIMGWDEKKSASVYLAAIILFTLSRFFFTALMRYTQPSKLLVFASFGAIICTIGVIFTTGWFAVATLIGISVFMSLMFPTIYGYALDGLGSDAKIGASGLIMAILGGAIITPLQGKISDLFNIHISYIVPLICFAVVINYGFMVIKHKRNV